MLDKKAAEFHVVMCEEPEHVAICTPAPPRNLSDGQIIPRTQPDCRCTVRVAVRSAPVENEERRHEIAMFAIPYQFIGMSSVL